MKIRIISIGTIALSICVHADVSVLNVAKDTMLRSATTVDEADLGGATTAYFSKTGARVIMEFDLSGLGQTVTNAVLKIRQASNISGAYNVQVFPMVYTSNNYSWIQGVGTITSGSDANAPADASGAASYRYRFNSTTDLAWEDGSGTGVSNASAPALWGAEIGQETGTGWASGTYSAIVLDAATIEASRTSSGAITIGLWDANSVGTGNFQISAMEAATAAYRPVLEVTTVAGPSPYEQWIGGYNLTDTNVLVDSDSDGVNNLVEYALGGNPTNGTGDQSVLPVSAIVVDGGFNGVEYVYRRRLDAAARNLDYYLELADDLTSGSWTNGGYTVPGTAVVDSEFETVTNRISSDGVDQRFIRLQIQITP